jgi:hypothetical protein
MVMCPKCGEDVLYRCTCYSTEEERFSVYIERVKLILEVVKKLRKGWKPFVTFIFYDSEGRELGRGGAYAKVERIGEYCFKATAEVESVAGAEAVEVVVEDEGGSVLLRKRAPAARASSFVVDWYVGVPRVEG